MLVWLVRPLLLLRWTRAIQLLLFHSMTWCPFTIRESKSFRTHNEGMSLTFNTYGGVCILLPAVTQTSPPLKQSLQGSLSVLASHLTFNFLHRSHARALQQMRCYTDKKTWSSLRFRFAIILNFPIMILPISVSIPTWCPFTIRESKRFRTRRGDESDV